MRRDQLLLAEITVAAERIVELTSGRDSAHPDVPWSDAVRLRNRIVHGYWSIDLEVLVTTARDDMPAFLAEVRAIDVHEGDVDH